VGIKTNMCHIFVAAQSNHCQQEDTVTRLN
jgi:hypothetical protein